MVVVIYGVDGVDVHNIFFIMYAIMISCVREYL